MIKIIKDHEPRELTEYREKQPVNGWRPSYNEMSQIESGYCNPDGSSLNLHDHVLNLLIKEQGGLCAYCMCKIPEVDRRTGMIRKATIEHIIPQSATRNTKEWKTELKYSNFLAVCSGNVGNGALCCDKKRENRPLSLNPLEENSIRWISYSNKGTIKALDGAPDKEMIERELNDVLNLNDGKDLREKRRRALNGMIQVLQKSGNDKKLDVCKRKLAVLKRERTHKVEYVGILIYWLERHIWKLESSGGKSEVR